MAELVVELYGQRLGHLKGSWRSFDFVSTREAVEQFGIDSHVLSVSVPLAVVPVRGGKAHRQNFFRELLPEGQMLHHLSSVCVPTRTTTT